MKPHKKSHFRLFYFAIISLTMAFSNNSAKGSSMEKDSLLSAQLRNMANGKVLLGDYDADGDADIFICGLGTDSIQSFIYRNDGPSIYTEIDPGFPKLQFPDASWNDYDRDGDLDILFSGAVIINDSLVPECHLYAYENGSYQEIATEISGVYKGSSAWADFDRDGDQDLIISGATAETSSGWLIHTSCKLYLNEGSGSFIELSPGIKGVYNCRMDVSDYDKDLYPDILISGELYDDGGFWHRITKLYRNSGNNSFSQVETGLPALRKGDVAFGDYDNDGNTDIILNGDPATPTNIVYIYRNNGDGTFYDVGIEIIGTVHGSINWIDYDNDGDLDFLVSGIQFPTADQPVSEIYRNAGNNMFSNDHNVGITGLMYSDASWGDIDNDNDPDLIIMGYSDKEGNDPQSLAYTNVSIEQNTPPLSPSTMNTELTTEGVILSWDQGYDDETPMHGLSYNIRLGSTSSGSDIISPLSLQDGRRQVHQTGNAYQSLSAIIRDLEEGTYYWSVQTIDHGFVGSGFGIEQSFTVTATGIESNISDESYSIHAYPIPAKDRINLSIISPKNTRLTFSIISLSGASIAKYTSHEVTKGKNLITFDLNKSSSSSCILSITNNNNLIYSQKILIVKD